MALAFVVAVPLNRAQARSVSVYNWAEYIDKAVLDDFTKETGIDVVYNLFSTNEVLDAKLLVGTAEYDVVVPSYNYAVRQLNAGLLSLVDKSKLSNLKNLSPKAMQLIAEGDPENTFLVPYLYGTAGIAYNMGIAKSHLPPNVAIDSWAMLTDPKIMQAMGRCGVQLIDGPDEILPIALISMGKNFKSNDSADLQAAADVVRSIAPYVDRFDSGDYASRLVSGEICMAYAWSGDIYSAFRKSKEAKLDVDIVYVLPKEGAFIFFDTFAIPKNAPDKEAAHIFINYMLRPEVIARVTNKTGYPNPNVLSRPMVDPALLENPSFFPNVDAQDLEIQDAKSIEIGDLMVRLWTEAKLAR